MIAQIFDVFFALDDPNVFIDIVLTALIVALIGCAGYMIFVESMQNDRDEIRAKKVPPDLWGTLAGETDTDKLEEKKLSDGTKALLRVSCIVLVAIIILLIVKSKI